MNDLTSGVRILPEVQGNPRDIVTLFNNISTTNARQQAQQQALDAKKYEPFYKMMDEISLKDVDGKDLETIMGKYNELGKEWTAVMAQTGGKPDWKQMLDLQKKKDDVMGLIGKHTTYKDEWKKAYADYVMKAPKGVDIKATGENLQKINELPLEERYKALQTGQWLTREPVTFSIAEPFKNKEITAVTTTDVNGNYRYDREGTTQSVKTYLSTSAGQQALADSGLDEQGFIDLAVNKGREYVTDHIKTKSSSDGEGGGKKTVKIESEGDFIISDKNGQYTARNGGIVKGATEADFIQLSATVLTPTSKLPLVEDAAGNKVEGEWDKTGNRKVLINEAKVGWVPKDAKTGKKLTDKQLEDSRKKGNKIIWERVINTFSGDVPVEIEAYKLTPKERSMFGLDDNYRMGDYTYQQKYGKAETAQPETNAWSKYKR